jgi:hypothetical protein
MNFNTANLFHGSSKILLITVSLLEMEGLHKNRDGDSLAAAEISARPSDSRFFFYINIWKYLKSEKPELRSCFTN